jgi:hypothetical protein
MSPNLLSEVVEPKLLFAALDLGGTTSDAAAAALNTTNAAGQHWVSLANHHKVLFTVFLGDLTKLSAWTGSDDIATITVQQATASAGTGVKAVTSQTYTITAGQLEENGDVAQIEVKQEDLDVSNSFYFVRVKVAVTDNSTTNQVSCVAQLYQPRYSKISRDNIEVFLPDSGYGA